MFTHSVTNLLARYFLMFVLFYFDSEVMGLLEVTHRNLTSQEFQNRLIKVIKSDRIQLIQIYYKSIFSVDSQVIKLNYVILLLIGYLLFLI